MKCLSQVGYITKTNHDSFKLHMVQKTLKFRKVTPGNLKIGKLSVTLATWNFQELLGMNFDLKLT